MNQAWVLRTVLERMRREADDKFPLETGGLLIGYRSADDADVVVTDIVGPGPNAIHRATRYVPDYAYHRQEMSRIFNTSNGMATYLGDWHSHPGSRPHLSACDRRALRNIARFPENYIAWPIMVVLGGGGGRNEGAWTAAAWRIIPLAPARLWSRWEYLRLGLREYEE
jgi:integrative and conjugative element protein (TIGR02256 family)